jgi:uncharacterized cupin superfamily protein
MGRACCFVFIAFTTLSAIAGCGRGGAGAAPRIVPPGNAPTLAFPGALTSVLLEASATEGDIAVLELFVEPRSFGAPPHVHRDEDEYFYVLEGEVRLLNDESVVAAPAGSFAAMTRGHLHAFWNASDQPARLLVAIAPGAFGAFFDQVVVELRASNETDPAAVGRTVARIAKEWNVDIHPERVPDEAKPFLPQ